VEHSIHLSDLSTILKVGETAARNAGIYLYQKLGTAQIASQKALHDDLLDVDLEAEQIILTYLHQETPQLEIVSEETAPKEKYTNYWIVDPLDGSANFQHGNPFFAIAIALVLNQTTVGSIIYLPLPNEMFTAILGQGAFLNGKHIHVSRTNTLDGAILHLGDFAKGNNQQTTHKRINDTLALTASVYRVRMIGTAATDLAYLACGRADLLVNHAASPWDIEAGKLLILEAGGKASTKKRENRTIHIYSNGNIHQEAENLLNIPN
jgi:myo-inositol-1(or 4)-monophosphatase